MTRKAITSNRFARREPSRKQQPTVLIICEDSKSSLNYLEDAARYYRAYAKLEVVHVGSAPQTIVQAALQRARDFNEVYCVIDRDTHPRFEEALNAASAQPKINMVVSYPCFEFWLLLHFKRTRKPYAAKGNKSPADAVVSDLQKCGGMASYSKGDTADLFNLLLPRLDTNAYKNAALIWQAAIADSEHNPSTQIDQLLHRFNALGTIV